jgi:ribosomal protein S8
LQNKNAKDAGDLEPILTNIIFTYADTALGRSRRRSDLRSIVKMSQDIVADALNQVMNAKRTGVDSTVVKRHSKVLLGILAIGKLKGYIKDYRVDGISIHIEFGKLNACRAVKPRYVVKVKSIDKYVRRYLPARDMGTVVISTSEGLMTHQTAIEKNKGGSVIAYFY